jgi:hypothetical protein
VGRGLHLLTDPTFDPPGAYPVGDRVLHKTAGPALGAEELGSSTRCCSPTTSTRTTSTPWAGPTWPACRWCSRPPRPPTGWAGTSGALPAWTSVALPRPGDQVLHITGVPALHGPVGSEQLVGEVTGFVLGGQDLPTVYVSGDNASVEVARGVADRVGPVDVAVLFAGAARTALAGGACLTLTSQAAAEAAKLLGARAVVPLHFEGWAHFTQGRDTLAAAFDRAGLADRLHLPEPGGWVEL